VSKIKLSKDFIHNTVKRALNEDLYPSGDITSSLVKNNKIIKVKLLSNQNAIIGGLLFAKQAFDLIDNKIKFIIKKKMVPKLKKGSLIATIEGKAKNILNCRKSCFKFFISYLRYCYKNKSVCKISW
jgi:nicotinate-nucleotide pyrophosphorylase (carboxylating)